MTRQKVSAKKTDHRERKRGRPRASDDLDKKRDILLAAIDHFGARGYDGVSLQQIASSVDADVALTRYYFGSKEGLWRAVVEHLESELFGNGIALYEKAYPTVTEQMKTVIRWFVDVSAKWPQLSRIIIFDGNSDTFRGEFIKTRLVNPFYAVMQVMIKGAIAEGTLPNVTPRTIFFLITHGGSFPMALPVLTNAYPGGDIAKPRTLKAHSDALISIIFNEKE